MFFDSLIRLDQNIVTYFQAHQTSFGYNFFSFLTFVGEWWFILGISIILIIVFTREKQYQRIVALLFSTIGTEAFTFFLKLLVHRARPPYYSYTLFEHFASFPSGHAALSVSFYGFLLYLILKNESNRTMRTLYSTIGVAFIVLIGFSRIYLGYHYPSDVIAGFFIGSMFLFIALVIVEGTTLRSILHLVPSPQTIYRKKKLHQKRNSR